MRATHHVLAVHEEVKKGRSHEVDPLPDMKAAKTLIFQLCEDWLENPTAYSRANDSELQDLFSDEEGEEG